MIDFNVIPSPCYVMEEKLLRNNLALIKSVKERAGVNIILAFKAYPISISRRQFRTIQFMGRK
jgi:carboxynorspermidine decarboxylase